MKTAYSLKFLLALSIFSFAFCVGKGQTIDTSIEKFTVIKSIKATPVKDQHRSITCWSFAVLSMLESELVQSGKGEYDLSEMFIVYHAYIEKADRFIRMHGNINFGGGGALNDPIDMIKKYGIVPDEAYTGMKSGSFIHDHLEMDAKLKDYVLTVIKNSKISLTWKNGFTAILDAYMGKPPEKFIYKEKEYTPVSFSKELGINPDNYILFTSFTHHPYYQKFIIEVPDNWSWGGAYNLPLNEFKNIIDYVLDNGNSLAIASDYIEKGFYLKKGYALAISDTGNYNSGREIIITQQLRQEAFDNYETTDDHDFHLTGTATDQYGKKFYTAKSSWGTEATEHNGYMYLSESYVLYKTLTILVNKRSLPSDVLKMPGI